MRPTIYLNNYIPVTSIHYSAAHIHLKGVTEELAILYMGRITNKSINIILWELSTAADAGLALGWEELAEDAVNHAVELDSLLEGSEEVAADVEEDLDLVEPEFQLHAADAEEAQEDSG